MTSIHRWPLLLSGLLAVALTGCASDPQPERKQSFENEAEAFAAAEKTYRAYVDALNDVDLSDPETFEAVYAWTTGELSASDRRVFSAWHADGTRKSGDARVASIIGTEAQDDFVAMETCYDVSQVDVVDSTGASLVVADRPAVQALRLRFVASSETRTGLSLESMSPTIEARSC